MGRLRSSASSWVVPVLLTLWLLLTAALGVTARYTAGGIAALTLLYGLMASALWQGARFLRALGRPSGAAGAYLLGLVVVWQLREQTRIPDSLAVTAAAALLPAALLWLALRGGVPGRWRRYLLSALVAGGALLLLIVAVFGCAPVLRWHLLRHNTLVGTPAYYLLEDPVSHREQELFAAAESRSTAEPPPLPDITAPAVRPNVVFILIDALRADALGAFGARMGQMPRLDRLIEESYRFTDVTANASWTRPSMGSFFTGLLPEEHGARDIADALAEERVTLAEIFRQRGYATAAFVANIAAVGRSSGFAQGFDHFVEFPDRPYARAETVNGEVRRWLRDARSQPIFLWLHYLDPHEPYLSGSPPRRRREADYRTAYRAELVYLDRNLEELLGVLRAELDPPSVIFLTSDHGEEFFEHGLFGHGQSLYGELLRLPAALFVDEGRGGEVAAPLEARDFFRLLLEYAPASEGFSVEQWARDHARSSRYASLYYSMEGRLVLRPYLREIAMRAVESDGHKLIWSAYGDTVELYRLDVDPGELVNLAAEQPALAKRLVAALDEEVTFWSPGAELIASQEELEQLRALGYVF